MHMYMPAYMRVCVCAHACGHGGQRILGVFLHHSHYPRGEAGLLLDLELAVQQGLLHLPGAAGTAGQLPHPPFLLNGF